jgi:hypothetical protein
VGVLVVGLPVGVNVEGEVDGALVIGYVGDPVGAVTVGVAVGVLVVGEALVGDRVVGDREGVCTQHPHRISPHIRCVHF